MRRVVKIFYLTLASREISQPTWATEGEFVSPIIKHELYFKILQNYRFDNMRERHETF